MSSKTVPVTIGFLLLAGACASTAPHYIVSSDGGVDEEGGSRSTTTSSSSSGGGATGGATTSGGGTTSSSSGSGTEDDSGSVGTEEGGGAEGGSGSSLPLSDDFESDTVGMPPSSKLWSLVGTMGCSGSGNPSAKVVWPITVDNTQHHSGSNSLMVQGGDSCGPLMVNTSAFASLTSGEVYGRFYVHLSDTTMMFDHAVVAALGLNAGGAINPGDQMTYLQLASEGAGNSTNVFMWQTTDGNILPNKNSQGGAESTYVASTGFTCVEFHTSKSSGAIQTWVNGTLVAGLSDPPVPANGSQWTAPSPFTVTSFGLGWVVFSGENLTAWYDDVALSSSRIGCD